MSEEKISSEESRTEQSKSSDNIIFNFIFDELPDCRKCIKDVHANINNIIKRYQYSDLKFEFEYVGEMLYINPNYINQKEYPTLRLHLDGVYNNSNVSNIKCLFDMSRFAFVTKPIVLISLVGCTIYLEQFTLCIQKTYRLRTVLFRVNRSSSRARIYSFLFLDFRI
ncbi:Hypothetical_protein [Hexamita inflata]|uniref:Hypothetical_protein n=1 Tax=Hexamita inflata TaxID=28002 RepID=A0AA86N7N1_9EUKA|nr:Hypothetical protein HINF_LOCUS2139 [Hexamita inflata]